MKRIVCMITILVLALVLASCGNKEKEDKAEEKGCEVAVIVEDAKAAGGTFSKAVWKSVKSFADEYEIAAGKYKPEDASKEACLASVQKATEDGAKLIVFPGESFAAAVYQAQSSYPDVKFLILDAVPHDESGTYATAANTISIIFAEEEAGYLAGYAAVKDGCTKLGFLGSDAGTGIKRYGYGFVQGAAAAAAEDEVKVELAYKYAGTAEASDEVKAMAADMYGGGTEVVFVCGGSLADSVVKAAEKSSGKVIGADTDRSALSETVITSAEKGIDAAVGNVLKSYKKGTFTGGTAFNYAAKNDGVMLEMENAAFRSFDENAYNKVFRKLKNGKIELKKDTGVSSVSELAGEWVTVKEI